MLVRAQREPCSCARSTAQRTLVSGACCTSQLWRRPRLGLPARPVASLGHVPSQDSFSSRATLRSGGESYEIFRLDALQASHDVARLPYSLKILLENLLRHEDGAAVTADDVENVARWGASDEPSKEIAYTPSRVLMQDFTGVPAVVDLAAMRDAMAEMGGEPERINPLVPAELVIDHSIQVDEFATKLAFAHNVEFDYGRNR